MFSPPYVLVKPEPCGWWLIARAKDGTCEWRHTSSLSMWCVPFHHRPPPNSANHGLTLYGIYFNKVPRKLTSFSRRCTYWYTGKLANHFTTNIADPTVPRLCFNKASAPAHTPRCKSKTDVTSNNTAVGIGVTLEFISPPFLLAFFKIILRYPVKCASCVTLFPMASFLK
jgi:hypothetical protein